MAKILTHSLCKPGEPDVEFYCPGCKCHHGVWITSKNEKDAQWTYNYNPDKPTFSPSLKITYPYRRGMPDARIDICHCIITDGKIFYCQDSTHELSGQTIDLPEIENS